MAIDVVCHMEIEPVEGNTPAVEYKGEVFYFCSNLCMVNFEANPQKYLQEYVRTAGQKKHKGSGNQKTS